MYELYDDRALKITFEDGYQYCKDWYPHFFFQDYSSLTIGVYIVVMNLVIQYLFNYLGRNKKARTTADRYIYQAISIFTM